VLTERRAIDVPTDWYGNRLSQLSSTLQRNLLQPVDQSDADASHGDYFFLPEPKLGCHPAVFWLGAAAIVLIFSFFGFLDSRLPFCSPLPMPISLGLMTLHFNAEFHIDA
jgi:hypothetical protein